MSLLLQYVCLYLYLVSLLCVLGVSAVAVETQFCKAAQQMLAVPSPQLCVPLASGGDPTYAFNVKLSGEEVHGTSERLSLSLSLSGCV